MEALVQAFDLYVSFLAEGSRPRYHAVWREWIKFIGARAGSAVPFDGLRYLQFVSAKPGQKPRVESDPIVACSGTVRLKISILRKLYAFFIEHHVFTGVNPFVDAVHRLPHAEKFQKRVTEAIADNEVWRLLAVCGTVGRTNIRNRAFVACLLGGGLRITEALELTLADVRKSEVRLRHTKAQKPATQPLTQWAIEEVSALVAQRLMEGALPTNRLFVGYNKADRMVNESWSRRAAYKHFLQLADRAELSGRITPHSCRATYATKLLSEGVEHRIVQHLMRHSTIAMVERYDKRTIQVDPAVKLIRWGK